MDNCLFCRIVKGDIPSTKVYEDEQVYSFMDINPQTPFHALVVPKKHISSVSEVDKLQDSEIAACLRAVARIAADNGLTGGYRVISNCGPDACQSVPHLHFHILGGRPMADRMA